MGTSWPLIDKRLIFDLLTEYVYVGFKELLDNFNVPIVFTNI